MESKNYDSKGRFIRGNKSAKKEHTREMAKHLTSQELFRAATLITEHSYKELQDMVKDGTLADESFLTYSMIKNIVDGKKSHQALSWAIEMLVGKPKQQLEHSGHIKNQEMDLSKLTERELKQLEKISKKATT